MNFISSNCRNMSLIHQIRRSPNMKHGHSTVILYSIINLGQFLDTTEISSAYDKLISDILQGLSFSVCQNCSCDIYHSNFLNKLDVSCKQTD